MSNRLTEQKDRFRLRLPPAEAQVVSGLLAGMLMLLAVQSENIAPGPLLILIILFLAGVAAKRAWAVWLMLGVLIYLRYLFNQPYRLSDLYGLKLSDLTVTLVIVLLAAACFRQLELGKFLAAFYPEVKLGENLKTGNQFEFPSLFGGRWWVIPFAVILATFVLGFVPFERSPTVRQLRIEPNVSRLIFLTLLMFFAWFVCRAVVGTMVRRRMKPQQADVHCRSLIAKELWKEAFDFERRRVKQLAKERKLNARTNSSDT